MKILLIYPHCLEDRIHTEDVSAPPMGLFYIGALLRENGYDAEIINLQEIGGRPGAIEKLLAEKAPDVVGFSVLNANRWGAIDAARIVKRIKPETPVVFGGVGATYLWDHFLTHFPEVDFVVMGEGERTFLSLIRHLRDSGGEGADAIPGIAFRRGGLNIRSEPAEPVKDLDRLPHPAKHFTFQHLSLTRGCPSNCAFCGSPGFWGRRVRFHSADYFVDGMEMLHRRGVGFFFVSDDIFTMRPGLVIEICRKIIDRGLAVSWAAISKVSHVDETMLHWMRRAGCVQISYGVESGSETIRSVLNKAITDDQIERAFSLTVRYGILARAYFIYGCPGETSETIGETLALMKRIRPLSAIFYILDLFPGTALFEGIKKKLGMTDDLWLERIEDILYFQVDPALSREDVLAFGKRLRESFYRMLPEAAAAIEVVDDETLYPFHADFFSRLAMTFSHGDYAGIDAIPDREGVARMLYRRALRYGPDHRAYLGLGILLQKRREFRESAEILARGIACFPDSPDLHTCLGISRMNLGAYRAALENFQKFPDSDPARTYAAECRRRMEGNRL
jgi:anaerobic magnesium-protoporphyrin IX monomethyl ester cyclase